MSITFSKSKPFKYELHDWVRVVKGEHQGKTMTISDRYRTAGINYYSGHHAGKPFTVTEDELGLY